MKTITVRLSNELFERVVNQAEAQDIAPDQLVAELVMECLTPHHPYVEVVNRAGGPRAVVKGTRIGVDVIVGYTHAGYSVHEIADEILPDLTAAQIYDALSYYEDNRNEIDELIRESQPDAVRKRLYEELGAEKAAKVLGEKRGAS